jgi:predicted DNA-binding protein (UPF0251 family)
MEPESPMQTQDDCRLRTVLEFTPPDGCPIDRTEQDIVEVNVVTAGDERRYELVLADEADDVETVEIPASSCEERVWPIFERLGCFARVLNVRQGNVVASIHLPDRTTYLDLLDELTSVCETVRTIALVDHGGTPGAMTDPQASVQLSTLTAKEWEALELAVAKGYYEKPRRVSLADLAAEFGITRAAVSQRLNRAERKIVTQLFTGD